MNNLRDGSFFYLSKKKVGNFFSIKEGREESNGKKDGCDYMALSRAKKL